MIHFFDPVITAFHADVALGSYFRFHDQEANHISLSQSKSSIFPFLDLIFLKKALYLMESRPRSCRSHDQPPVVWPLTSHHAEKVFPEIYRHLHVLQDPLAPLTKVLVK